MIRSSSACLIALAVAVCLPPMAVAKPRQRLSDCQKLAERKDVAPGRTLVVVVRGDDETGRISACVLPRGRIRTLASWDDGLSRDWANVVATAGTFVLVEEGHGDQYGGVSRSLKRVEVRHRRTLGLSGYGCLTGPGPFMCPSGTDYGKIVMSARGAGAYEVTDHATGATTLQGFSAAGAFAKLADGAVQSLALDGMQIRWTQGGVTYTAPLP